MNGMIKEHNNEKTFSKEVVAERTQREIDLPRVRWDSCRNS